MFCHKQKPFPVVYAYSFGHISLVPQIDQKAVRGRVAALKTAENFRWFDITCGAEHAAGHNFKQLTTGKAMLGVIDNGGVFALLHVVFNYRIVAP